MGIGGRANKNYPHPPTSNRIYPLWMDMGGHGWTWMDVGGRGWTCVDVGGRGWTWMDVGSFGLGRFHLRLG